MRGLMRGLIRVQNVFEYRKTPAIKFLKRIYLCIFKLRMFLLRIIGLPQNSLLQKCRFGTSGYELLALLEVPK